MAKKKPPSLADEAKSELPHEYIAQLRSLERRLSGATAMAKIEKAKREAVEKELELSEARHEFLSDLGPKPETQLDFRPLKHRGQATAIIVLTDWHVEEPVDPETINGLNEYNLEIADKRIKQVCYRSLDLLESARKLSKISHLVVAVLGDLISGYIHEELEENNLLSPTEASLWASEKLVRCLDYYKTNAAVNRIDVVTSFGNHSRTTRKMRAATAYKNSYEWLMYNHLAGYYKGDPQVNWHIEKGYHNLVDIQGKRVRFHHGDGIRYAGGVGGISIPVNKAIAEWDKTLPADLDVFGHYHQHLWHKKFVACNCLIGYSPYAQKVIKAQYSAPSQAFIVIDKKRPGAIQVSEIFAT